MLLSGDALLADVFGLALVGLAAEDEGVTDRAHQEKHQPLPGVPEVWPVVRSGRLKCLDVDRGRWRELDRLDVDGRQVCGHLLVDALNVDPGEGGESSVRSVFRADAAPLLREPNSPAYSRGSKCLKVGFEADQVAPDLSDPTNSDRDGSIPRSNRNHQVATSVAIERAVSDEHSVIDQPCSIQVGVAELDVIWFFGEQFVCLKRLECCAGPDGVAFFDSFVVTGELPYRSKCERQQERSRE